LSHCPINVNGMNEFKQSKKEDWWRKKREDVTA
jgi:hypothetical protein